MEPRRRQSTSAGPGTPEASLLPDDRETFRPLATGAFMRRCSAAPATVPLDSLPDALALERDADGDGPRVALL